MKDVTPNPDNNQTRRLMLAVVLSLLIMLGFEYGAPYFMPPKPAPVAAGAQVPAAAAVGSQAPESVAGVLGVSGTGVMASLPGTVEPVAPVVLDNGVARVSISPLGSKIESWILTQFAVTHGEELGYGQLKMDGVRAEYVESGWQGAGVQAPGAQARWQDACGAPQLPDGTLPECNARRTVWTWSNASGQTFTRVIELAADTYVLKVTDSIANAATLPVSMTPYMQVHRADGGFPEEHSSFVNFLGPMGAVMHPEEKDRYLVHEVGFDDLQDEKASVPVKGTGGWWGVSSQYFLTALVPMGDEASTRSFRVSEVAGKAVYTASVQGEPVVVEPGARVVAEAMIYAGPKREADLLAVNHGLERAIDWGWFRVIARPFYWALLWFHGYVGNWGVAIVLLTLVLKLVTFPLANKSYHAMSKMKKLQPEMEKLRERHKDDQQGMAMAMMKLYKDHKVNPLSGCWPMVIQIPLFFAMYKVVLLAFELRHAPLGLWITDLSVADPYFVLPVLMGLSMFVQQWLNPPPADPTQAMVFKWMPVIFTFMFLWFPAALVFYWFVNNVFSVAQQWYIMRKDRAI